MNATWVHVTSGEGPVECERAARLVADALVREAAEAGLAAAVLDAVPGAATGLLRSALIALEGEGLDEFLLFWTGTVRWICRSPYRPPNRRKNWFVGVERLAASEETAWTADEVRVEVMRASGPGGQHANTTASAVRVTHEPTGLVAIAREERSQHRNKAPALARLAELIAGANRQAQRQAGTARREQHRGLVRGNAVRTSEGPDFKRTTEFRT